MQEDIAERLLEEIETGLENEHGIYPAVGLEIELYLRNIPNADAILAKRKDIAFSFVEMYLFQANNVNFDNLLALGLPDDVTKNIKRLHHTMVWARDDDEQQEAAQALSNALWEGFGHSKSELLYKCMHAKTVMKEMAQELGESLPYGRENIAHAMLNALTGMDGFVEMRESAIDHPPASLMPAAYGVLDTLIIMRCHAENIPLREIKSERVTHLSRYEHDRREYIFFHEQGRNYDPVSHRQALRDARRFFDITEETLREFGVEIDLSVENGQYVHAQTSMHYTGKNDRTPRNLYAGKAIKKIGEGAAEYFKAALGAFCNEKTLQFFARTKDTPAPHRFTCGDEDSDPRHKIPGGVNHIYESKQETIINARSYKALENRIANVTMPLSEFLLHNLLGNMYGMERAGLLPYRDVSGMPGLPRGNPHCRQRDNRLYTSVQEAAEHYMLPGNFELNLRMTGREYVQSVLDRIAPGRQIDAVCEEHAQQPGLIEQIAHVAQAVKHAMHLGRASS